MLLPCIIPSSPVVCCELIKTALAMIGPSLPPPFLLPAVCVSSCHAAMSPPVLCPRRACLPRTAADSRRFDVSGSPLVLAPPCSPLYSCREAGRDDLPVLFLLACSVMSSCPWRCRLIRGDLSCVCLLVLASVGCGSFPVPLSRLVSFARPVCSCRGAGSLRRRVHCCPSYLSHAGEG